VKVTQVIEILIVIAIAIGAITGADGKPSGAGAKRALVFVKFIIYINYVIY
jgi:hypothetical protein